MKTDWKDDVFPGNRKWTITENGDGTSNIVDSTVYTQEGDAFGAKELNEIGAEVNRTQGMKSITLTVAGWTGTAAPFEQTVPVDGVTADDIPTIGIIYQSGCTRAQQKAINKAAGYIYDLETKAGAVTVRCTQKPVTAITLGLKGV